MRLGEAVVFLTTSVLLGIIGYKVIGWWAPGTIFASYAFGTYLNYKFPGRDNVRTRFMGNFRYQV